MNRQAPFLRSSDRVFHHNLDLLIALVPTLVLPVLYYGWRPLLLVAAGIVTAVLCELLCNGLMHRRPTVGDGSAAATGAFIGALMSPLCPYWLPALGAAFAILVVKMPFGGNGRYLFSPTAAAMAVLTQCWPHRLFTYPVLHTALPLDVNIPAGSIVTETSPAGQLYVGTHTVYDGVSLLMGMVPGPMAATGILVLLACAVYLFIRRSAFLSVTLVYLGTCVLWAVLFPRLEGPWYLSVTMELCSGYLVFAGVFLLTSCITPRSRTGRLLYGVLAGVLVMSFRRWGQFEEGACFAILLANALAPLLDRYGWRIQSWKRHWRARREASAV